MKEPAQISKRAILVQATRTYGHLILMSFSIFMLCICCVITTLFIVELRFVKDQSRIQEREFRLAQEEWTDIKAVLKAKYNIEVTH